VIIYFYLIAKEIIMSTIFNFYGIISFILLLLIFGIIWQRQAVFTIIDLFKVLSEEKEWISELKTPEDLLDYIIAHPRDVSLVAYQINSSDQEIDYNSDIKRPLASTIKILILAEYARQVEKGILSPDELVNLDNIDIFYLPRTDSEAHPTALMELTKKKYINTANQIELRHVIWTMIRYSDNAATDYLIRRLGRNNLEDLIVKLNIKNQDVPLPIIGQILTWSNHTCFDTYAERLKKYQAMSRPAYADQVYDLTEIWLHDEEFRAKQIKHITSNKWLEFKEQQAMAEALNCKGTTSGYAQIMERIYRGLLISPTADKIMREYLEWPMEFSRNREQLDTFGAKGGSLAGILTEAWYMKPQTSTSAIGALFFENIAAGVWFKMLQSYIQQDFLYKLLTDDKFFDIVRERLLEGSREM
jgi:D-alanyl-D-alanine carboxypeptidase